MREAGARAIKLSTKLKDTLPKTITILANEVIIMFQLKHCITLAQTESADDRASVRQESERGRDSEAGISVHVPWPLR